MELKHKSFWVQKIVKSHGYAVFSESSWNMRVVETMHKTFFIARIHRYFLASSPLVLRR